MFGPLIGAAIQLSTKAVVGIVAGAAVTGGVIYHGNKRLREELELTRTYQELGERRLDETEYAMAKIRQEVGDLDKRMTDAELWLLIEQQRNRSNRR